MNQLTGRTGLMAEVVGADALVSRVCFSRAGVRRSNVAVKATPSGPPRFFERRASGLVLTEVWTMRSSNKQFVSLAMIETLEATSHETMRDSAMSIGRNA